MVNKYECLILNTHPIQYFAPIYRMLNSNCSLEFSVIYASKRGIKQSIDDGFGASFKWDVNLLEGYSSIFLDEAERNTARPTNQIKCPSIKRYLGQFNPSCIVVHGYYDPMARAALSWASRRDVKVVLRGDTWSGPGEVGGRIRRMVKNIWFKHRVEPVVNKFCYVGKRNSAYWSSLRVPLEKIVSVPYGVDKSVFRPNKINNKSLRSDLGISPETKIIGFLGKFSKKKGISQLARYFSLQATHLSNSVFLFAGSGLGKSAAVTDLVAAGNTVVDLGFVNQSQIASIYQVCDLVLVPSIFEESWGFVVQEALACGTSVAVSECVGCAPDLVRHGINGWVLPVGAWEEWSTFLKAWDGGSISGQAAMEKYIDVSRITGIEESAAALSEVVKS